MNHTYVYVCVYIYTHVYDMCVYMYKISVPVFVWHRIQSSQHTDSHHLKANLGQLSNNQSFSFHSFIQCSAPMTTKNPDFH